MRDTDTFQQHTESLIRLYTSRPYGRLCIPGTIGNTAYTLCLVTRSCINDDHIIRLLARWRKKHERWFVEQFPITQKRTRLWLAHNVIDKPDRILFLIRVHGTYRGHIGLYRFDFRQKTCAIDNVIRGTKGYPGLMEAAIRSMITWGRAHLGLVGYTLQTTSDNEKALTLYKRLGFIEIKRVAVKNRYQVFMRRKLRSSKKKIAFAGPSITSREIAAVADGVKNGFYENFDRHIKKLEHAMSSYVGTEYALAGFCATHSMHLACLVCGFGRGDEVIVTDFSWVATAHVIAYTGATPVFVDIDPKTWCIDPVAIERAITKKTKGIMIVHSFGLPADMDAIMAIAKKYKLKVIEDAAPALGSLYKGKKVGGLADVGCVSFHGAKIAVSGEGGMFLTNSKKMLDQAVLFSNMGRTNRLAIFWCDQMGYEYQMANVTASLALAQVQRIEELVRMKRKIFSWYWERLKNVREVTLLKEQPGMRANYAYPAVYLNTKRISRDTLIKKLRSYNIHAREAFPRMSKFPMYTARFPNPVATGVEKNGFNLPSALNLTESDVDFACDVLVELIKK